MNAPAHVAIIDDNPPQRMILTKLLEHHYRVTALASGIALLDTSEPFDAILLDIEMPELDGYETCRRLRARGIQTPIIFVSAHDTAPERIAAYEAGGDDFVTKPITADELRHKLAGAIAQRRRLAELSEASASAQAVAFTAMSSMGDLGVVIDFLRASTACQDDEAIASYLLSATTAWGLKGAVQIRSRRRTLSRTTGETMSPLQSAVLETLRDIGRIFEMGPRAIINYDQVSLLIENLPTQDPDKVGRLRDHLAVLVESADLRIQGLDAVDERDLQKLGIEGVLAELRTTLHRIGEQSRINRENGQTHMVTTLEQLAHSMDTFGLTEIQRGYVGDLVREMLDDTHAFFDQAASLEVEFSQVQARLERLVAGDYRL